ncbi:5,6-dimethylbenzimidazole synthase [Halovibrio salipaludis]|uniref:5,6-dimethylbenzimidazole synthase n=1 Tax=Halovibrio salipaludis TaxID=2032626 RepID=A0A2A2F8W5_9GAMM|nr:5,6-dimethylbenzimidazole synthase [Halovibrio salipaludis]PAU81961.1 5,6-dimethylbenzimidazole synthase [Halovibrio salipaludis]
MEPQHAFSDDERQALYRCIAERRDMRHFLPDPVPEAVLMRLLQAAHKAPSVGLMQPWHFIRVTDTDLRERIHQLVDTERARTAEALGERGNEFMKLKVEGIRDCGELLVVTLRDGRERHIFGRRTLPEMDLASASCAIQNLWLAARAEGLGMGWVSLFDPRALAELLSIPEEGHPMAILCLGHVEAFYERPMLEIEGWTEGLSLDHFLSENHYRTEEDS